MTIINLAIDPVKSIRSNYLALEEQDSQPIHDTMVNLMCMVVLIQNGVKSVHDSLEVAKEYYNTLLPKGCVVCPYVENCIACEICA